MFQQITILGPGLLGASLALALKERQLCQRVHTWSRRRDTRALAASADWCDAVFESAAEAVRGSDLVVICTPVETILPLLREVSPSLKESALVTDVGSTKQQICHKAKSVYAPFIGSHPMAGSERTGMENARSDLFSGAACMLTPLESHDPTRVAQITRLWEAVGMKVTQCTPAQHDRIVAHISHLPHLIASSLCSYLDQTDPSWKLLAGSGLRDTTRVAAGDPALWQQILEQNRQEILSAIAGFQTELTRLQRSLENQDTPELFAQLEQGKSFRETL